MKRIFGFLVGLSGIVACIFTVLAYFDRGQSQALTPPLNTVPTNFPISTVTRTLPTLTAILPTPTTIPPTNTPLVPTPTLTPCPPGCTLYQADWSRGRSDWLGPQSWTTTGDGMLLNDGTNGLYRRGGLGRIMAPYKLGQHGIVDYAVEAEIQMVRSDQAECGSGFGIIVRLDEENRSADSLDRGGYWIGVQNDNFNQRSFLYATAGIPFGWGCGPNTVLAQEPIAVDKKPHIYRVEVQGNSIRLLVDQNLRFEENDNRYRSGGQVGLWSVATQLAVRYLKIIKL
jgi:hypothetical protein